VKKGVPYTRIPAAGKSGSGKSVSPEDIRALLLKNIKVKDVEKLEKQWKTFIAEISIDGPEARLKRGLRAVYQWEFEDALPDLDAAIEAGIQDPRAYWGRGRANFWSGKPDKAIEDFRKAVEMDPLNPSFRYSLSESLHMDGMMSRGGNDKDAAEATLQAALAVELDPENDRYREWYDEIR